MQFPASFIRKVTYPLLKWRAGELAELRYLKQFRESQFWSLERLKDYQLSKLREQIEYVSANCPFYRERLSQVGFCASDLRSFDDYSNVPILRKTDIQEHRDEMVSPLVAPEQRIINQTGGSTGEPISFYLDRDRLSSRTAATWRHNQWAGMDIGEPIALVWGAPPDAPPGGLRSFARQILFGRKLYLDTAKLSEDLFMDFHKRLMKSKPKVIQAYAGSLALFSKFLRDAEVRPYSPKAIITSAETLTLEDRKLIEDVFRAPIFNRYGCREFSVIGSECEHHDGLHLMAEGLYVEVLANGRPVAPGETGQLVVTDLLNKAMPLIRYEIGDVGSIDFSPCKCGRGLPRLKSVEGRVTDFLVGTDGRLVSGVFLATYLIANRPQLGQVQIIQNAKDKIEFVLDGDVSRPIEMEDEVFLKNEAHRYLGQKMEVIVRREPLQLQAASGKLRYCRSTLLSEQLGRHESS